MGDLVIITVKPLVAQLDRLKGIHLDEVRDMRLDKLLHFLQSDTIRHTFLLKEAEF